MKLSILLRDLTLSIMIHHVQMRIGKDSPNYSILL